MEKLYSEKNTKKTTPSATQQFIDVAEIKEDVIVLKNGALRAVLGVSSINFDLKSTEEQEAVVGHYQSFLNSVDFPVQILISSRKINMDKYLDFLTDKEKQQSSELMRLQISEYRNFIRQLISVSNIMDKSFYIIVPFSPIENKEGGFFKNLQSLLDPKKNILEKRENFEIYKSQLNQRIDQVVAALSGIGLKIIPLKTQELIELMFNSYNPSTANNSGLGDVSNIELK